MSGNNNTNTTLIILFLWASSLDFRSGDGGGNRNLCSEEEDTAVSGVRLLSSSLVSSFLF